METKQQKNDREIANSWRFFGRFFGGAIVTCFALSFFLEEGSWPMRVFPLVGGLLLAVLMGRKEKRDLQKP